MRTIIDKETGEIVKYEKQYTFEEMNSGEKKARAFPIQKENSWIRLKMEAYKMSNGK